jgi:hypothetical protein
MDTINIKLGFKLDGIFFGYADGELYQLPYKKGCKYYPLRKLKKKYQQGGWPYYRIRRKKFGVKKIAAMLENVNWEVNKPFDINL